MQFTSYTRLIAIGIKDSLEYRFDILLSIVKYSLVTLAMAVVWSAVYDATKNPLFAPREMLSYFSWAAILYGVSNFHPFYWESDIRQGTMARFLLRPVSVYWFYCHFQAGLTFFIEMLTKIVVLVPLIWMVGGQLPRLANVAVAGLFAILSFLLMFTLSVSISTLGFWLVDVWGIRFSVLAMTRLLSGMFIPLYVLPSNVQTWLQWLPFPATAYWPIRILQGKATSEQIIWQLVVLITWLLIFAQIYRWLWRHAVRAHEGVGL